MWPYDQSAEPPIPSLEVLVRHPWIEDKFLYILLGRNILNYFYINLNGPLLNFTFSLNPPSHNPNTPE